MKQTLFIVMIAAIAGGAAFAQDNIGDFTEEELAVAKFWADMGPTLRDEGIEAYAERYHDDFRHWDIQRAGSMANKESAVGYWTKFHDAGHRITCTFVTPITVDIIGDKAFARLEYEQTIRFADGKTTTGVWRMVDIFARYGDTWQVLESNMIDIAPKDDGDETADENSYAFHCPES